MKILLILLLNCYLCSSEHKNEDINNNFNNNQSIFPLLNNAAIENVQSMQEELPQTIEEKNAIEKTRINTEIEKAITSDKFDVFHIGNIFYDAYKKDICGIDLNRINDLIKILNLDNFFNNIALKNIILYINKNDIKIDNSIINSILQNLFSGKQLNTADVLSPIFFYVNKNKVVINNYYINRSFKVVFENNSTNICTVLERIFSYANKNKIRINDDNIDAAFEKALNKDNHNILNEIFININNRKYFKYIINENNLKQSLKSAINKNNYKFLDNIFYYYKINIQFKEQSTISEDTKNTFLEYNKLLMQKLLDNKDYDALKIVIDSFIDNDMEGLIVDKALKSVLDINNYDIAESILTYAGFHYSNVDPKDVMRVMKKGLDTSDSKFLLSVFHYLLPGDEENCFYETDFYNYENYSRDITIDKESIDSAIKIAFNDKDFYEINSLSEIDFLLEKIFRYTKYDNFEKIKIDEIIKLINLAFRNENITFLRNIFNNFSKKDPNIINSLLDDSYFEKNKEYEAEKLTYLVNYIFHKFELKKITYKNLIDKISFEYDSVEYSFGGDIVEFENGYSINRIGYLMRDRYYLQSLRECKYPVVTITNFATGDTYNTISAKYKNKNYKAAKFILPFPTDFVTMFIIRPTKSHYYEFLKKKDVVLKKIKKI